MKPREILEEIVTCDGCSIRGLSGCGCKEITNDTLSQLAEWVEGEKKVLVINGGEDIYKNIEHESYNQALTDIAKKIRGE